MTKKNINAKPEHSHLSLKLVDFTCSVGGGINSDLYEKRNMFDETSVFQFYSHIEVVARCSWPEDRAGHEFRLSIYDSNKNSEGFDSTLSDHRVLDDQGSPKYRKRGADHIPIYDPPKSVGFIDKCHGELAWYGAVWVPTAVLTNMIQVLSLPVPLFTAIHEVKYGRNRAISSIHIQTSDPEE